MACCLAYSIGMFRLVRALTLSWHAVFSSMPDARFCSILLRHSPVCAHVYVFAHACVCACECVCEVKLTRGGLLLAQLGKASGSNEGCLVCLPLQLSYLVLLQQHTQLSLS